MRPEELYTFDVNGYLVVPNAIEPDLLRELTPLVDAYERRAGMSSHADHERPGTEVRHTHRFERIILEDERFLRLAMSPAVIARIVHLIQNPRLKSTWLDFKAWNGRIGYHSNHTPYNPVDAYYFQDGIRANLVTVCYALCDIPEDGGALDVLPGSHKANLPLPQDAATLTSLRRKLPLRAGDALIFSHDMNHGSHNRLDYVRRCLFTSFSTGSSAHTQGENGLYDPLFENSSEGSWQKYLLRRPKGDRDSYPQPTHAVDEEALPITESGRALARACD